jgi:hypothetical protein
MTNRIKMRPVITASALVLVLLLGLGGAEYLLNLRAQNDAQCLLQAVRALKVGESTADDVRRVAAVLEMSTYPSQVIATTWILYNRSKYPVYPRPTWSHDAGAAMVRKLSVESFGAVRNLARAPLLRTICRVGEPLVSLGGHVFCSKCYGQLLSTALTYG